MLSLTTSFLKIKKTRLRTIKKTPNIKPSIPGLTYLLKKAPIETNIIAGIPRYNNSLLSKPFLKKAILVTLLD
ncbi:hypothetical protein JCM19314_1543 [Nonlabens ulvanivorans]|uniref:Uncharacterized protein n=1 Tax=Nonlabens ulvanivorans TaxID=906888 RepID=A0A090QFF4_NONUL|nr:hypothetical protein JCM19314_1543 [Nonlabens ulvanivorans]